MNITQAEIDKAAYDLVTGRRDYLRQLRKDLGYEKQWKADENSYFNGSADFYKGISKVRVPVLHQAVERIVPKLDKVNFPPDGEYFEARAKNKNDDIAVEDANAVTALIKQQFTDISARAKLVSTYRSLCTYGTLFVKVIWRHEKKKRYKRVKGKREELWETVFDNPDFYSPSIWDIYVDPKDEDLEGDLIEREIIDYQEIWKRREQKDGTGIYRNTEQVKDLHHEREQDTDKQVSDRTRQIAKDNPAPHEHRVNLLYFWGRVPLWYLTKKEEDRKSGEYAEDALIVVAEGGEGSGVTLRISDNPFDHQMKPYLADQYIKVGGRIYGIGVMTPNIGLEAELNTLRNQLVDMRTFMLKKKYLRNRDAEIPDYQLKDLKNTVIDTQDVNGLRELMQQDFSASAINSELNIKQDIEDSTGASKLLSGTPSGSSLDRTASGVSTVVQGGLERFELVATQFQEEILKKLIRMFWYLNQQFLPEGREVDMVGKEMVRVFPDEINIKDKDLNFVGMKEIGEKGFKINALNILLQNLTPYIPMGLDPIPVVMRFFKLVGMGDLAQEVDRRPETELEETPEGEVQLLRMGRDVKINLNDDHDLYIQAYQELLGEQELAPNVRKNTQEALGQRMIAKGLIANKSVLRSLIPNEAERAA